ncbi:MAG TPA: DUF1232 domain-containing protein [Vicinamibacteria bacterium]|nr:DUF1232 domain-containing protein [Vicinamibacteria bacterium]
MFARLLRTLALLRDPRVAKLPRFALVAAILYTLWPADLLPDFLVPLVGYLDDLTLVWLALRWLRRNEPAGAVAPGKLAPDPPART